MTTKSALDYLRQMPHAYYNLSMEYVISRSEINALNAPCDSLPEALKRLNVWTPGKAREGYGFWANLYYHYSGAGNPLPMIPKATIAIMQHEARSYIFMEAYNKAEFYKGILEQLFEPMLPNKKTEQVFMRMILMTALYNSHIVGLSLATIGKVVAKAIDRRNIFDHATVIHNLSTHNDLLDANDRTYCGMYERFKQALANIESHLNRPVESESVEQFEPEFGC